MKSTGKIIGLQNAIRFQECLEILNEAITKLEDAKGYAEKYEIASPEETALLQVIDERAMEEVKEAKKMENLDEKIAEVGRIYEVICEIQNKMSAETATLFKICLFLRHLMQKRDEVIAEGAEELLLVSPEERISFSGNGTKPPAS